MGRIRADVIQGLIAIALWEKNRLTLGLSFSVGNDLAFEFLSFGRICVYVFFDPGETDAEYKTRRNLLRLVKAVKGRVYSFGVG